MKNKERKAFFNTITGLSFILLLVTLVILIISLLLFAVPSLLYHRPDFYNGYLLTDLIFRILTLVFILLFLVFYIRSLFKKDTGLAKATFILGIVATATCLLSFAVGGAVMPSYMNFVGSAFTSFDELYYLVILATYLMSAIFLAELALGRFVNYKNLKNNEKSED